MIVVTEDPRLHLVWIYDRVFIKPPVRLLLERGANIEAKSAGGYPIWRQYRRFFA
jgi:hypothetical protein